MSDASKKTRGPWVEEEHEGCLRLCYRVRERLFSATSEHQHVEIVDTEGFGRVLLTDSIAQVSERDEFVYHEMIAHVPLFVHPAARQVLVIGGGDGGTVREVLRHHSVARCRLVEIDPVVIEACRAHIPWTAATLDDPRCELTIEDGVRFVRETDEKFDVVLVDSGDPLGPAEPLFGAGFYRDIRRVLSDDGIIVSQAGSPFYGKADQQSLLRIMAGLFPRVHLYNYSNLLYPGGLWSFVYGSRGDHCPVADVDASRVRRLAGSFSYYGRGVHRSAFVHPAFQEYALKSLVTPHKEVRPESCEPCSS